jgi:succinyl-CoA synthetase beta subunit
MPVNIETGLDAGALATAAKNLGMEEQTDQMANMF